jgi:DNA primase
MRISTEIKKRVSALDVCRQYGVDVNRAGFARCLWHNEKTASLKIYPGDRGYFCFGCHAHGSSIDLVMKLFDESVGDACKRLNADFRLGLIQEGNLSTAERIARNKAAWERKKQAEREEKEHRELIDEFNGAIYHLRAVEMLYDAAAPTDKDEEWSEAFTVAAKERERARARADEALEALQEFEKKRFAS